MQWDLLFGVFKFAFEKGKVPILDQHSYEIWVSLLFPVATRI